MTIEIKDGAVLKDGAQVATYSAETKVVYSRKRLGPSVNKAIRECLGFKPVFDVGAPNAPAQVNKERTEGVSTDDIPPAPEKTARDGDKTPAYVDWLRRHHPEEAAERYANRAV